MQIAILGGTGDMGEGLALRLARDTDHDVVVGSRDADRAAIAAAEYEAELDRHGFDRAIDGVENAAAAERADVVVVAVPAYHLTDAIEQVAGSLDDVVLVSPAIGMKRDEAGFHYNRPSAGSVTALAARAAPDGVPVVGAFHTFAAARLADIDADIDWDTVVVGDDPEARDTVMALADDVEGLRALDGGPLANAAEVESVTPLLINVARHNERMHDLGIEFR